MCYMPVEKIYHTSQIFSPCCAVCGSEDQKEHADLESASMKAMCSGKKAYPICNQCVKDGFQPVTHGAEDKTGKAYKRKKGAKRADDDESDDEGDKEEESEDDDSVRGTASNPATRTPRSTSARSAIRSCTTSAPSSARSSARWCRRARAAAAASTARRCWASRRPTRWSARRRCRSTTRRSTGQRLSRRTHAPSALSWR